MVKIEGPGQRVTIYIGNSDRWHGHPLHSAIIQRARQEGLAGATVTVGIEGFGANSRIHRASILDLSTDLPVKIEIVDTRARIQPFLDVLDTMVDEGLIAVEECTIIKYAHSPKQAG